MEGEEIQTHRQREGGGGGGGVGREGGERERERGSVVDHINTSGTVF